VETQGPGGERLLLEPVRPEHAERLRALRRTPEVARWWDPAPETWPLEAEADLHKLAVVVDGEVAGDVRHHRITLGTSVDNARAIRCYEKVGFRKVGVMRKSNRSHVTGEWEDELLMELVV